jgi:catechol 2,3-dioxygenase-like lactoylglutathione lyase family enzyme
MSIIGVDHVQLAMPPGSEARARAFYGDVLELPERPKPPELAARGGCWFESESVKIHLGVEQDFRPSAKAHPGLLVDDLDSVLSRCRQKGFQASEPELIEATRRAFVQDPFGNRIELMERMLARRRGPDAA